jgi:hypothetical protein
MWGHYGDRHRGLVVGFDASSVVFQPEHGRRLRSVDYVRERVLFDATWKETDPGIRTFEQRLVFSKNEDWHYEDELRQLFQLSLLRQKPLDNGSLGFFLPLPPSAIVSVTLGAKCPDEIQKKVQSALSQSCLAHVQRDHAILHESEFNLVFDKSAG